MIIAARQATCANFLQMGNKDIFYTENTSQDHQVVCGPCSCVLAWQKMFSVLLVRSCQAGLDLQHLWRFSSALHRTLGSGWVSIMISINPTTHHTLPWSIILDNSVESIKLHFILAQLLVKHHTGVLKLVTPQNLTGQVGGANLGKQFLMKFSFENRYQKFSNVSSFQYRYLKCLILIHNIQDFQQSYRKCYQKILEVFNKR